MTKKTQKAPEELRYIPLNDPAIVWTTYDLGCSAALVCAGFELLTMDKKDPRKALFIFRRQDGIEGVVDLYWSDHLQISARRYFDTIKMLKNRLYSE